MSAQRIFLVAGEMSGDTHGAELMASLEQLSANEVTFAGLGGPKMAAWKLDDWIGDAAVVGLWEVLKKYGYFKRRFADAMAAIETFQPEVVVLIDYPGFNLRLAKALRKAGQCALGLQAVWSGAPGAARGRALRCQGALRQMVTKALRKS